MRHNHIFLETSNYCSVHNDLYYVALPIQSLVEPWELKSQDWSTKVFYAANWLNLSMIFALLTTGKKKKKKSDSRTQKNLLEKFSPNIANIAIVWYMLKERMHNIFCFLRWKPHPLKEMIRTLSVHYSNAKKDSYGFGPFGIFFYKSLISNRNLIFQTWKRFSQFLHVTNWLLMQIKSQ